MFYSTGMSRKPDAHRLFFALMPPVDLLNELARLRELTTQGKPEADSRLHVTMFLFDHTPAFDVNKVEQISAALDGQVLPTCRATRSGQKHDAAASQRETGGRVRVASPACRVAWA